MWKDDVVDLDQVFDSAVGVKLHRAIDAYDLVLRSVKYSILFIVLTFAAFLLFIALATMMYATCHIDWYAAEKGEA